MLFLDKDHGLSACPTNGTRFSHQWNAALPPVDHGFATRGTTPHVLSCPTSCFLVKSTKSLHPAQNLCNPYEKQSVISAQPLRNPYATPRNPYTPLSPSSPIYPSVMPPRVARTSFFVDFSLTLRRVARGCAGLRRGSRAVIHCVVADCKHFARGVGFLSISLMNMNTNCHNNHNLIQVSDVNNLLSVK